ncbi:MAG TPA: ribonuclease III [Candidatus Sulfotelmatobacter sp.]|nr:ribonuclease III [Candidatus Sulfotelmatobacter sp.]
MNIPEFKNKKLFDQAFTHRSYLNEIKEKLSSNERLEFLGDSIISFVVSQYLYEKYPYFDEGVLTNIRSLLVNTKSLAQIAKSLDFGKFLKLSRGEEESKGRQNQSLLADSFESYVGALFIDQGIDIVSTFLEEIFVPKAEEIAKNKSFKDPKSLLQEYVQSKKQNSPSYKVLQESGPAHARNFRIGVYINSKLIGEGLGKSKREAEENAAEKALTFFRASRAIEKSNK